jgi:4-alpha-glucanotransferase
VDLPPPGRPSVLARPDLEPALARLADLCGVATWYTDQGGRPVPVDPATVVAVLGLLGRDGSSSTAARAAARALVAQRYRELAPPIVVGRSGSTNLVDLHPPAGVPVHAELRTSAGGTRPLVGLPRGGWATVDGERRETRTVVLDGGLPLGWHDLRVVAGDAAVTVPVVIAPYRLPPPPRCWGWAVQLYATRSAAGWGVGDLADLAELARWTGERHGASFLLVNPLHAVAAGPPMEPSPYSPASRRFVNPMYLRVERTALYRVAPPDVRRQVDALRPPPERLDPDRIDRDAAWAAQQQALRLLFASLPPEPARLDRFRADNAGVDDFALWSVLAGEHGPDYRRWPAELRRPDSAAVAAARRERADEVDFHVWLQVEAADQLAAAQSAARAAGQPIGIIHDLAVGVSAGGADAWALQQVLAAGATIGAPPDGFNQAGQDWRLPPWHPDRLRAAGYAPFRDIVRAAVRHGGGVRVDHVLGLFRLWWVPEGCPPTRGTYVRYRDAELLGVLAAEAALAGAVVIGEDLGTVPSRVRRELAGRGILGSAVLWFQRGRTGPLPLPSWRRQIAASVTNHDLPTAAGFLAGEQVRVRAEHGLLRRPVAEEQAAAERELAELLSLLRSEGVLAEGAGVGETVRALYAAVARTPALLVVAALSDAVGDLRQPNLPGTTDSYPNWRLPIAEPDGAGGHRPLTLEDLEAHPGPRLLAAVLSRERPRAAPAAGGEASGPARELG